MPFSVDYGKSAKGKSSQLELNVSFRDESNRMFRAHLVTCDCRRDMKESLTGENMESNLMKLQTENLMLKQELVMMKQSHEPGISGQDSDGRYEKLMQEVSKLKSVVDKVSNSRY